MHLETLRNVNVLRKNSLRVYLKAESFSNGKCCVFWINLTKTW
ncbi:hypothetical protein H4684_003169 [Desulfomicrobium macestii]|uniref:Uncharacterized protein n=1 Tax=Desulfomicrobium macestii TaxID=90731 RepID=A0ABR9H710_9BACT|nr:hypothetical protein [Desulfomicrobium macestii]